MTHDNKINGGEVKKTDIALREEAVLAFWQKNDIFNKSVNEKEAPNGDFAFHDGPPFATGTPHYGHLVPSAMKDAIPRYKTMRGYRVKRQWGWDCHGLPIENIVEKELGTKSKKDIVDMGVKVFNDACRKQIFTYVDIWNDFIPRFGRWADMEKPYKTMDKDYMESEWWAFSELYKKGLIYEAYRSMHICPRCETTLSQSEVTEGYKDVKDLSVTAKFHLKAGQKFADGKYETKSAAYILAWTTTPWTLPGNVALAVGANIKYTALRVNGVKELLFVASNRVADVCKGQEVEVVHDDLTGNDLVGLEYEPLFDYYSKDATLKNRENGWKVVSADFVTDDAGTGIAHEAPAFGAEDMALGKEKNLPFVQHVGMDGRFKPEVTDFAGIHVKPKDDVQATDVLIIKNLATRGLLFSKEKIEHSYPHCWRCDTPLLNYATSSWFVAVEKIKPELVEYAKDINWSPEHIKEGRFGKWLEGARDWSISRQRFWANTIPVWRCEKCNKDQVFGSVKDLEDASGKKVEDLHKDVVDEITVPCSCGGVAKRVTDVLDTWFDSGSVPFASLHYPFENESEFVKRVPADFIAEATDQCRAWFYYQHVLAGGLFKKNAFKNVVVNGIVLSSEGKKLSKRLKNYTDPADLLDKYGADATRLFLLSSTVVHAEDVIFTDAGVAEVARKVIVRLVNSHTLYAQYKDAVTHEASDASTNVLDRWIVARVREVAHEVTKKMDEYDLQGGARPLIDFVDDLSTWYIRRSRDRFKGDDETDKKAALATTAWVLKEYAKLVAPFAPFIAEWLWQEMQPPAPPLSGGQNTREHFLPPDKGDRGGLLHEDPESVHLAAWPTVKSLTAEESTLLTQMKAARDVVSLGLQKRSESGIKVRQPLAKLETNVDLPEILLSVVAEEVNVKNVVFGTETKLDTNLTPELIREGQVRDFLRAVQDLRKKSGLKQGESAKLMVRGDAGALEIIKSAEAEILKTASLSEIELSTGGDAGECVTMGEAKVFITL